MIKVISSKKCWQYNFSGHPESTERVKATYEFLLKHGYEISEPSPCKEKDILAVHSLSVVENVKSGGFIDGDTPNNKNMYEFALLSAGAAIGAAESALKGKPAFSLMRPPGHHAFKNHSGGFCYFNNIAIAVQHLLMLPLLKWGGIPMNNTSGFGIPTDGINPRIAILDIDCHHGNGTQDIFLGDENVLFISIHQSPLYPGSGLKSEKNCINFPIRPGSDETAYLEVLTKAIDEIMKYKPDLLAVSAGFDTYEDDPLTNLGLAKSSYGKIAEKIKETGLPRFAVLEGGYSSSLPECVLNFVSCLKI